MSLASESAQPRISDTAGKPVDEDRNHPSTSNFVAVNGGSSPQQHRGRSRSRSVGQRHYDSAVVPPRHDASEVWQNGDRRRHSPPPEYRRDLPTSPGKRKRADSDEQRFVLGAFTATDKEMEERQRMDQDQAQHLAEAKESAWYDPRPRIEERVREALTSEMNMHDERTSAAAGHDASPGTEDHMDDPQHSEYGTDTTPQSGAQFDPRKRKRMFSNRTKTGCLTCRRRKKKCDEAKPECNNCIRGGFVCEGYSLKSVFARPSAPKPQPVMHSLQSKENYYGHAGAYAGGYNDLPPPHVEASDGPRARPVMVEEPRPHTRAGSHADQNSQNFFSRYPPPPTEPTPREYIPRPPSFDHPRETSRELPGLSSTSAPPPQRAMSASHTSPSSRYVGVTQQDQRDDGTILEPSTVPRDFDAFQWQRNSQAVAQHALALQPTLKSEKQRMLDGERYMPFNEELVDEREQCKAAVWRFNNSTNPSNGHSRADRERLFKAIIEPEHLTRQLPSSSNLRVGRVGGGVAVEAPFMCDYGYNIHIGDEVVVGAGCTILDPCTVTIGARTILGPNVSIYGMTYSHDPHYRGGSRGPAKGGPVTIEEDCLIEGGVIIMGGVNIGKRSTIKAGTVVSKDIAPSTVWGPHPEQSCVCIKGAYNPPSPETEPRYSSYGR